MAEETQALPRNLAELMAKLDAEGITDYRRYKEICSYLDFKSREKLIPIKGTFELTPLCNLDCKMCYVHLNRDQLKGANLLTVEQWKDLMQQAIDNGMMFASITGGECLTYPGFKELYLFLQERGIQINILSNGILMDDDMVEFLKVNRPALIQVTVYGTSDDGYEKVTGRREFDRVMKNITALKDAGMPLTIAITPNEFMDDGVELVRLLSEKGFTFSVNSGIMSPHENTGREIHDAAVMTYVDIMRAWREETGKELLPKCDEEDLPAVGGNGEHVKGIKCAAGRSAFAIGWNGLMRPCNMFPCEPQNVLEMGFNAAWKKLNDIATNFVTPVECDGCKYQRSCKHCVVEHASGAPVGHANPRTCEWVKCMIKEGIYRFVPND